MDDRQPSDATLSLAAASRALRHSALRARGGRYQAKAALGMSRAAEAAAASVATFSEVVSAGDELAANQWSMSETFLDLPGG